MTNLIEQLGGYERAKRVEKNVYGTGSRLIRYPSEDFDYNDDGGNVCDVELISFKANDLKKSLLEYRRHHNILEIGDKVFLAETENEVQTVTERTKELFYNLGFVHCTDKEIAQGYRDE